MEMWRRKGKALIEEIQATQTAAGEIALWYIGQVGYIVKAGKRIVMIDPVLNDLTGPDGQTRRHYPAPFGPGDLKPDAVVCTHGHADHMAPSTLRGIAEAFPETVFVVPAGCAAKARQCGVQAERIHALDAGEVYADGDFRAAAFSAAHPTHCDGEDMALGYQLSFGGVRVTHLGDTYLTEQLLGDLKRLAPHHVFLPPINGDDRFRAMRDCIGNMEAEEAAKLAALLDTDLSIPTHFDMVMDNTVDPLRFAAELRRICPAAKWKIPALGERILYRPE